MSRLYLWMYRAWTRLQRIADIGFTGFWLGVLSPRQLHAIDELMYQRSDTYRSREHNLRGLFPWEEEALAEHFAECKKLLVIGAGGGREVLALANRGLEVTGYECNPALVAFAQDLIREHGSSGTVELLARDAAPPEGRRYDGAIIGWDAYMLIMGRKQRIHLLNALHGQLRDGAPVLLSFFCRQTNTSRYAAIARLANVPRRLLRRPFIEIGDDLAPNYVHRFMEVEIEQELSEAGFLLASYRAEQPGPYDPGHAVGIRQTTNSIGVP